MSAVVRFRVYFRSPVTGRWKLQHGFESCVSAVDCAKNIARSGHSAYVTKATLDARTGLPLAERTISEHGRAA